MNSLPLVSIITLNYNQAEVTCALLASIQHLTYPRIEVLVVDNKSTEDPSQRINQEQYPHVSLIINSENLGFAGGNNVGIQRSQGEYLLLLNNDTEVEPDLIERLLEPFAADATIGAVSPKIRYYESPTLVQYAGYTPLNQYTGQAWAIGSQQEDRGQFNEAGFTSFAHGAAMMVRRKVVEQAGLLPDVYFLYYEELDWCCRIRAAGYAIYYQPSALVYHKESMTVGKSNPLKVYYQTRNRILFMRRNVPLLPLLVFLLYYTCMAFPKALALYGLNGRLNFLRAYLSGIGWHFCNTVIRPTAFARPATEPGANQLTLTTRI